MLKNSSKIDKPGSYSLLDSGNGRKLEQFGPYRIERPAAQAIWTPRLPLKEWQKRDALFTRDTVGRWQKKIEKPWTIEIAGLFFKIALTEFGHLGIFPEQEPFWKSMQNSLKKGMSLLNLFAYSGGATLAAAKLGVKVCHLDASKKMVNWAKENAALNGLTKAPIRWIVDDVTKFLKREIKRKQHYDAIILDPPSFGRGPKGEVFKIEEDLLPLLKMCQKLLSQKPSFLLLSCHTPGITPLVLTQLLQETLEKFPGTIQSGEMTIKPKTKNFSLPSGSFARWTHEDSCDQ